MRCAPPLWTGFLLLATLWPQAGAEVLRTAAQEGSAPKFFDTHPAQGHCPDILAALERTDPALKFQTDPTPTPIKRLEYDLRAGRIDVICALLETPARLELAHRLPTPVYWVQERLVGRQGDTLLVTRLQDLALPGLVVVTQSGASYAQDLRQVGVNVVETTGGSPVALRNVESGRARFYYTNALTGAYSIRQSGLGDRLRLHPGVLRSSPSYLWVGRHLDNTTVQRLERALAQLKRNGELDAIYQRYERTAP